MEAGTMPGIGRVIKALVTGAAPLAVTSRRALRLPCHACGTVGIADA